MAAFKDLYEIIKELVQLSKAAQNQEVMQLAMDLQEKFFELREENQELLTEITALKSKLETYQHPQVNEQDIEYYTKGFFTLTSDTPKIPYCTYCWKRHRTLSPLAQHQNWWQYRCAECSSQVAVMDDKGNEIR